jgi:ATP-dependent Lon protease
MAPAKPLNLPVIPLAKDTVLLPGIVLRIPVTSNRSDIPALLSKIYSQVATKTPDQRLDNISIACVPLNSSLLNNYGQRLLTQNDKKAKSQERLDLNPSSATKEDLFGFGTAAKISAVEGRGTGEIALLVEGVCRLRVEDVTQERPFFEADVTYEYDEGMLQIAEVCTNNLLMLYSRLARRRCDPRPL